MGSALLSSLSAEYSANVRPSLNCATIGSMPESKEDEEKRLLRELEAKNVANYSILVKAWIDTRMARDKALVTLSAGGIGVLITLLTTVGVSHPWYIVLYAFSFLGFLVTIGLALHIYQLNSKMIENDMRGRSDEELNLPRWDKLLLASFGMGAVFAFATAVFSALNPPSQERNAMGNHEERSLGGLTDLKPQHPQEKPPASSSQSPSTPTESKPPVSPNEKPNGRP